MARWLDDAKKRLQVRSALEIKAWEDRIDQYIDNKWTGGSFQIEYQPGDLPEHLFEALKTKYTAAGWTVKKEGFNDFRDSYFYLKITPNEVPLR